MAECKEDISQTAGNMRLKQYNDISKLYPQSKCTFNTMPQHIQEHYKAYREYPIDLIGCPDRDKVFVLNSDCTKFKRVPKDTYPDKNLDDNKYSDCILSGGNCDYILDDINKKRLDYTIKQNLESCNTSHGSGCGIYDINNFIYTENKLKKYVMYSIPIILCCMSVFCVIIILLLLIL